MRLLFILIISVLFFIGCSREQSKPISFYFENNCDLDTLSVGIYINGSLYKTIDVKRDSTQLYDASFKTSYPQEGKKDLYLMLIIKSKKDTADLVVPSEKMDSIDYFHVNYVETVLRKGFIVYDRALDKDSLAYRDFYCEPVFKRGKKKTVLTP